MDVQAETERQAASSSDQNVCYKPVYHKIEHKLEDPKIRDRKNSLALNNMCIWWTYSSVKSGADSQSLLHLQIRHVQHFQE